MKLSTAINNALKVAGRIRSVNGMVGTPGTDFECFRIKRAWVFGSTIKGKSHPNDLDILIDGYGCGIQFTSNKLHSKSFPSRFRIGSRIDRTMLRVEKAYYELRSSFICCKYLAGNLKKIRIHQLDIDGDIAHPRIMIYPRNDLLARIKTASNPVS
jgi:hypothetical protein